MVSRARGRAAHVTVQLLPGVEVAPLEKATVEPLAAEAAGLHDMMNHTAVASPMTSVAHTACQGAGSSNNSKSDPRNGLDKAKDGAGADAPGTAGSVQASTIKIIRSQGAAAAPPAHPDGRITSVADGGFAKESGVTVRPAQQAAVTPSEQLLQQLRGMVQHVQRSPRGRRANVAQRVGMSFAGTADTTAHLAVPAAAATCEMDTWPTLAAAAAHINPKGGSKRAAGVEPATPAVAAGDACKAARQTVTAPSVAQSTTAASGGAGSSSTLSTADNAIEYKHTLAPLYKYSTVEVAHRQGTSFISQGRLSKSAIKLPACQVGLNQGKLQLQPVAGKPPHMPKPTFSKALYSLASSTVVLCSRFHRSLHHKQASDNPTAAISVRRRCWGHCHAIPTPTPTTTYI